MQSSIVQPLQRRLRTVSAAFLSLKLTKQTILTTITTVRTIRTGPVESKATKTMSSTEKDKLTFSFDLSDLIDFIFPSNLQHPLTTARLYIFALYGPLDSSGHIRTGRKGSHVLMEYELDEMCQQMEREDLVQIYLHKPNDMGMLSTEEQEAIINQADNHLKKAKGKAMLPQLTKEDIIELFEVRKLLSCLLPG
jgi:hypothetical protein